MKSLKSIMLTSMLAFASFGVVTFTSCTKDECKDVVCQNGGTCDDENGACQCAAGYEGTDCGTATASKIVGTYTSTETCQPPVSGGSWTSNLTQSSQDATKIVISNFGNSGTNVLGKVNGNAITLETTVIGSNTVTGTGTISSNIVTINYNMAGTVSYACTITMNKQ